MNAAHEDPAIPSRADIDVHGSPDEAFAVRNFLGKSLDEAEALFRENSIYYQEDLLSMGPVAFRFYVRAAIRYVRSAHADGDSDIINCLAGILSFRQEHYPADLVPCAGLLGVFCDDVLKQFDRFHADPEIYPGLRERYQHLAEIFARTSHAAGDGQSRR